MRKTAYDKFRRKRILLDGSYCTQPFFLDEDFSCSCCSLSTRQMLETSSKKKTSYRVLQNDSRRSKHGKQAASRAAVVRLLLTLSSIDSHPRFSLVVARWATCSSRHARCHRPAPTPRNHHHSLFDKRTNSNVNWGVLIFCWRRSSVPRRSCIMMLAVTGCRPTAKIMWVSTLTIIFSRRGRKLMRVNKGVLLVCLWKSKALGWEPGARL